MPIYIQKRIPFYVTGNQLTKYYKGGNDSKKGLGGFFKTHMSEYQFRKGEMKNAFSKVFSDKKKFVKENSVQNESPYFFDVYGNEAIEEFPEILTFYGYFWGNFNLLNSSYHKIDIGSYILPYKESVPDIREHSYYLKGNKIHLEINVTKINRIIGFLNYFYVDLTDNELFCRHPDSDHPCVEFRSKRKNHLNDLLGNGTFYPWYWKPNLIKMLPLSMSSEVFIII